MYWMVYLAYPIDRLNLALFSVVILFHHLFPLLEKVEIRAFILPRNFPEALIIFLGAGRGGASIPGDKADGGDNDGDGGHWSPRVWSGRT